jgi:hypothetical protein
VLGLQEVSKSFLPTKEVVAMPEPASPPRMPAALKRTGMPVARLPDGRPIRMGKAEEGSGRGEVWALLRAAIVLLLTMGVIAVLIVG